MPGIKATPVEKKNGLKCIHCGYLLKNPVQTDDGVRLCKECFTEIQRMPGPCVDCGVSVDKEEGAFPDRAVARELADLKVYCDYKKLGCDWVGPLKEWESHCAQCDYKGVQCPNVGCPEILKKEKLAEHLQSCLYRLEDCKYCGENMVYVQMEEHHKSCDNFPVSCENCRENIARKELKEHQLNSCIIEECLICHKKVYRKTGREAADPTAKVSIDGSNSPTRASSETPDQSEEPHVCVVDENVSNPLNVSQIDSEITQEVPQNDLKMTREITQNDLDTHQNEARVEIVEQGHFSNFGSYVSPKSNYKNKSKGRLATDSDDPSPISRSNYRSQSRGRVVVDGDESSPSSSPKLTRSVNSHQRTRVSADGDAFDPSDRESSQDIDRDPDHVEVPVKQAGSYRAKSRGRVVADSNCRSSRQKGRVVTDGDGEDEDESSRQSQGCITTDNLGDNCNYTKPIDKAQNKYQNVPRVTIDGGSESLGCAYISNSSDSSDNSDRETTPQPYGEESFRTRVKRDGSGTEDSDSDKERMDSGISKDVTTKSRVGKTVKDPTRTFSDADDPYTEAPTPKERPVHLSVPLDNFQHHQKLAGRVIALEDLYATMATENKQQLQDINAGRKLIENLQSEITKLKEEHGKQQAYIASLETELTQVKEEVKVVARKPGVDKNQLDKLQQLVSERDQYITIQRKDLDEVKRQLPNLASKIDSNAVALQELQLKSRLSPNLRQPRTVGADVQYGNVISETRFIQLEHRVEDLARETSTTRAHLQELEIQLQAQVAATYNGSCLWRIPDVAKRRRDALEDRILSIYSPAFYTGRHGYKMCCRMYLNGDGMGLGTNISVFFVVMKGDYDALLKWPFEHKVSLILVDQTHRKHIVQTFKPTPDSSSFKRPVSDMNVASGCPQFASIDVLQDDRYVQADTMYIKCIVDTSKIFHP